MVTAHITVKPSTFDRVDRVKRAVGQPVLEDDDRFWILGSPLVVNIGGAVQEIPTGFTTDGASVPTWAQYLTGWRPWDVPQRWGGIVHDFLYSRPDTTRLYADRAFRAVLRSEGASAFRSFAMYQAVRIGGLWAYRANQARGPRIHV